MTTGADLLDANPFLWLHVLGKEREEVLAGVRVRLVDSGSVPGGKAESVLPSSPELNPDRFWATEADPTAIPVRSGSAAAPDALMRLLGPLPLPEEEQRVSIRAERLVRVGGHSYQVWDNEERTAQELLREYTARISQTAGAVARGEHPPVLSAEKLPGKAISYGSRIVSEILEAVGQEEGVVSVRQLRTACPTLAALPHAAAADALFEA